MNVLDYLLKSQVILLILYLFYAIFLHKKISFAFSRAYLLGIFPISFILPLIHIPAGSDSYVVVNAYLPHASVAVAAGRASFLSPSLSWYDVLTGGYVAGVLFGLIRLGIQILKGCVLLRRGKYRQTDEGSVLVAADSHSAFSLFGRIVIGEKHLDNPDISQIIRHEAWHGRFRHSLDLLFIALQKVFFWFNPMIWYLERSLRAVHEYQVDERMLISGADPYRYAVLLLNFEAEPAVQALTNRFSYLSLKDRIRMMATRRTVKANCRLLYLLVLLPLLVFLFCLIPGESLLATEVERVEISGEEEVIPFATCPVKPRFKGGDQNEFVRWVFQRIRYPQADKDAKIQGRVTLQFTVGKDGTVSDVRVLKGVSKTLDAEAVRVVSASPRWEPGKDLDGNPIKIRFTFPVIFQLNVHPSAEKES